MLAAARAGAKWFLGGLGIGVGIDGLDGAGRAVRWAVIGGVGYVAYKNRAAILKAFK